MRKFAAKLTICLLLLSALACSQESGTALLQKLGYSPNAKLLIVHADDMGMSHSVNAASFEALEKGWVSSGSIMVPCPWFNEAAEFASTHPQLDLGLHLTLTSEWRNYRWGPVGKHNVTSLIDGEGYFPRDTSLIATRVEPKEAVDEIAAQVEKAKAAGVKVTHLDNHMGGLSQSAVLFGAYVKLGRSLRVPVSFSQGEVRGYSGSVDVKGLPVPVGIGAGEYKDLLRAYGKVFSSLGPGIYIMVVHLGHDDAELRAIMREDAGTAAARQRDYDLVSSPEFHRVLRDNHIKMIGWKDLVPAM